MKRYLFVIVFGLAGSLGAYFLFHEKLPIMTCDPTTLTKGMTKEQVIAACGEPNNSNEHGKDWYPLSGDTRERKETRRNIQMVYGSIWDDKYRVNLYIRNGVLDSVQIYGDYK